MASSTEEDLEHLHSSIVHITDWIVFFIMLGTTMTISYKLMSYHGAPGTTFKLYYFGYREERTLSVIVCLAATVSYYSRICEHVSGDQSPTMTFVYTKYLDYIVTCPVLTMDLLWTLNLPYRFTYAIFIFCVILCGLLASMTPSPGKYLYFTMGLCLFAFTWFMILTKCYIRFMQLFGKRFIIPNQPRKHQSFASKHNTRDKNIREKLSIALVCYFLVWAVYPVLWLLVEFKAIDLVTSHVAHAICDVLAKAVYGMAMHKFVLMLDKRKVRSIFQLQVTLRDVVEAWQMNKKAARKDAIEAEKHQEEEQDSDDDYDEQDDDHDHDDNRDGDHDLERGGKHQPHVAPTSKPPITASAVPPLFPWAPNGVPAPARTPSDSSFGRVASASSVQHLLSPHTPAAAPPFYVRPATAVGPSAGSEQGLARAASGSGVAAAVPTATEVQPSS